jgi:uncharacterized protein (DUF4415 family)
MNARGRRKDKPPSQGEVVIDVTKEDYRREIASGIEEEYALKPGRHVFRRGGFKARHPDFEGAKKTPVKVRVNIYLDLDIINYFKGRAKSPDAAGYQTQINNALRSLIESKAEPLPELARLIDNDEFIAAVAERVSKRRPGRKAGSKRLNPARPQAAKRT